MIKAVVFDLDNTLVDFMKMKRLAIEAAASAMVDAGLPGSTEEAVKRIDAVYNEKGIEYQKVFDSFLEDTLDRVDHKILSAGIVGYRRAREAALIPYPHVYGTLNQLLKLGIRLGIVSDAPVREAWLRLAYMNFHHIFDVVVAFDEKSKRKPSPEPFQRALTRLEVNPAEALMVGDWADRDIIGAKETGMKTAFAKYGDVFDTREHGADYELSDIAELVEIIKEENNIA